MASRLARVDVPMHVQFVNPLQDSGILFADQFDIKEKKVDHTVRLESGHIAGFTANYPEVPVSSGG